MTTDLAAAPPAPHSSTRGAARGVLALGPDQTDWTPQQIAALRQLGIEDAPEGDLLVFRHVCQSTGLDPFRKQIYMIGRKTKVSYWDQQQRRKVEDWVMKYTIQTGIDGFRRNGREAAKREGNALRVDGPYWQGADGGGWQDVWLSDTPPAAAKFVIFRDGEAHAGIAMYREFVQTNTFDGKTTPNSMWAKMPANQLAKCAEAQAWRRAYPDDFSGVQLEDAVQIIEPDDAGPVHARAERVSAAAIAAAPTPGDGPTVQQWQAPEPASNPVEKPDTPQVDESAQVDVEPPETAEPASEPMSTVTQQRKLAALLDAQGVVEKGDKLHYLGEQFKRRFASAKELTRAEAADLIEYLERPIEDTDTQLPVDGAEGGE